MWEWLTRVGVAIFRKKPDAELSRVLFDEARLQITTLKHELGIALEKCRELEIKMEIPMLNEHCERELAELRKDYQTIIRYITEVNNKIQ